MPSKRDPSKQRRQSQNRAQRDALAVRREAAATPKPQRATSAAPDAETADATAADDTTTSGTTSSSSTRSRPTRSRAFANSPPGTRAAFYCLVFTIVALVLSFLQPVAVDEDGEPYSRDEVAELDRLEELEAAEDEGELTETEQEELDELQETWGDEPDNERPYFFALFPFSLAYIAAVVLAGLAIVVSRRSELPYKNWFRLLIGMALLTFLFAGDIGLLAATVALGVAYFQNRKAHLPPPGEGPPPSPFGGLFGGRRTRTAIDVDATEATPPTGSTRDEP